MTLEPNCYKRGCIHFTGVKKDDEDDETTERVVCKAFPDGIPDIIAYGNNKHMKILPNQINEIVFEK
jgi:hypothetical protein